MKELHEKAATSKICLETPAEPSTSTLTSDCLEPRPSDSQFSRESLWSSVFSSAFSVLESYRGSSTREKNGVHIKSNGWTSVVKKVVGGSSMRRLHERVLGPTNVGLPTSTSDIWLLGRCYKIATDGCPADAATINTLAEFTEDFSSRVLITYRKGFVAIGDSKFTSDVGWGCMVRSSQMLIAQALLCHQFGRSWRRPLAKPVEQDYINILHLFGDSKASAFSIHNLLLAGKSYGLAAGSWVGPYAMCRSWEALVHSKKEETIPEYRPFPMALYVVSGDENGERGGAPVVCIEDAHKSCLAFSDGRRDWTPILLLVPLVLGLDKVNPRYIPSLQATFTFPQSLGILGGKPGASTYMVGVQDDYAFYLDPHDVQQVKTITENQVPLISNLLLSSD
ncbi:Cysteine protease ATG4a [Linum perenne]